MKKLILFYLAVLVPLLSIIYCMFYKVLEAEYLVLSLLFYATIYRTSTDIIRLKSIGELSTRKELILFLIPFHGRRKYFRKLYFQI